MTKVIDTRGDIPTLTDQQRSRFLDLIRAQQNIGTVTALRKAGVPGKRGVLRSMLEADEDLAEEIREARGYGSDTIRREIARRAIEGVDEPVFWQGEIVGHVRKYSDRLLQMMGKAHLEEYRERSELDVSVNATVEIDDRSAPLDAVAAILRAVGASHTDSGTVPQRALPAAPDALAEPGDG